MERRQVILSRTGSSRESQVIWGDNGRRLNYSKGLEEVDGRQDNSEEEDTLSAYAE